MSMDISITLSDDDLQHFVDGIHKAQESAADASPETITAAARKLLESSRQGEVPDFIALRLERLETMIDLVLDEGFGLPEEDCKRVLAALTYFADPDDVIPDDVPVLGFLDDAIMIELCVRELRYELEAYDDFREWRSTEARRRGEDEAKLHVNRVEWAESRRVEAIERMRKHRRAAYAGGAWQPVLFKVN